MSTKSDKQSASSIEADHNFNRALAQVLGDNGIADAVAQLIKSVRSSQLTQINGKLDAMPRNVFKQAALVSIVSLTLGFGAGVLTNSKDWGWPVMVAWVTQHVPPQ
jgi:hypothetical protein